MIGANTHIVELLQHALLRWWDAEKRDLPWRRTRNAYRVWVSEVMLQQTRIEVVVPAYRRFLRAFPSLAALARASEDDVLSLWSGLGYYSRARALHRAAQSLHQAGRVFPRELEAARALPGVGAYTAAAVLSIAHQVPLAAVDGNVARVLSRLYRADDAGQREADELLDRARPGDWNQAMMELGQRLCTPKSPRCGECPVAAWCGARRAGEVESYPVPRRRRAVEEVAVSLVVVRDRRGRVLLERGVFPYLKHMWLPLLGEESRVLRTRCGRAARAPRGFQHAILHRRFSVSVGSRTAGVAEIRELLKVGERRLFASEDLRSIGRSALLTKALAETPGARAARPQRVRRTRHPSVEAHAPHHS